MCNVCVFNPAFFIYIFPQNNYLVFMAELFWWFEVVKPSFVKPRLLDNECTGMTLIMALLKCLLYQWKLCIMDIVLS